MRKILPKLKPILCFVVCIALIIAFVCIISKKDSKLTVGEEYVLNLWQIDTFEGGKGSRADYLQKAGESFFKNGGGYVKVTALTADAARLNLAEGNLPDLISYGAGITGLESFISSYRCWCYGGYCILTLDSNSDFSDITVDNTLINSGKDNFIDLTALFCGVSGAFKEKSTAAYVKLINGEYKYLLGTQRDIYRLKTRGVAFNVKPVTLFNDLYQNISVVNSSKYTKQAESFIEYLIGASTEINKLGLLSDKSVYEDEMHIMSGLTYEYKLTAPISESTKNQLEGLILNGDINMLKTLLK